MSGEARFRTARRRFDGSPFVALEAELVRMRERWKASGRPEPAAVCSRCSGTGRTPSGFPCGCQPIAARLVAAGVPEEFRAARLDVLPEWLEGDARSAVERRALALLAGVRRNRRPRVVLHGRPGRAKTALAVGLLAAAMEIHELSGAFVSVPGFVVRLQERRFERKGERFAMDEILRPEIVVLDDLGVVELDRWARGVMNAAIGERLQRERALVVTTNLTRAERAELYGDRIDSRLEALPVVGLGDLPDLRQIKRAAERRRLSSTKGASE